MILNKLSSELIVKSMAYSTWTITTRSTNIATTKMRKRWNNMKSRRRGVRSAISQMEVDKAAWGSWQKFEHLLLVDGSAGAGAAAAGYLHLHGHQIHTEDNRQTFPLLIRGENGGNRIRCDATGQRASVVGDGLHKTVSSYGSNGGRCAKHSTSIW